MKTIASTPFLSSRPRAAAAMVIFLTATLHAATYTWTGLNGATWNTTATNWTSGGASWRAFGNSADFQDVILESETL